MAGQAAAGEFEFEFALRAQIADARTQLEQARAARDLEAVTSLGLRLRYLQEVAAESGIDLAQSLTAEIGGRVDTDEGV